MSPPGAIDVAIIGNSRNAILDPTDETFRAAAGRAVNLSYSGADPGDEVALLRLLKQRHPQARVIVGLDPDRCFAGKTADLHYIDPALLVQDTRDALLRLTSLRSLADWARSLALAAIIGQRIMPAGNVVRRMPSAEEVRVMQQTDMETYGSLYRSSVFDLGCVTRAGDLARLAPDVVIMINPVSRPMRELAERYGLQLHFERWRRELTNLGTVIDFSCSDVLSGGPFMDGHHYGSEIARSVTADLAAVLAGREPRFGCVYPRTNGR